MAGLVDIAPSAEIVAIRGTDVTITGVSAKGIAHLLARFPALRKAFSGMEVEASELMSLGGEAVAAILAAGTGAPGDEAAEAAADSLNIEEQAELMAAILRVTLPRGVGPLVAKLEEMGLVLDGGASATAPATK